MTDSAAGHLRPLPQNANPYTDDEPLRVRDHPLQENPAALVIAAAVGLAPVLWLLVRLLSGARPVMTGELVLALSIGVPLAGAIALFPALLGSGARITLGASELRRELRRTRGETKTMPLSDIRGGIYASKVRHRRELSKELILFGDDGQILWIADGIAPDDVQQIAHALATYGVREYDGAITNDQLAALVRKARRQET